MAGFIIRRLLLIPVVLGLVNFAGFAYALIAQNVHRAGNPWGSHLEGPPPIWPQYTSYVRGVLRGNWGTLAFGIPEPIENLIGRALVASLGLLVLAFALSSVLGLVIGLRTVRSETASLSPWLVPLSAVGLAMPSFYIGTLFIVASVAYLLRAGEGARPPLPLAGFGWDVHLVLPTIALMVRPTVQIIQVTAGMLSGELGKQYIVAARSRGNSWRQARWRHALRNVLAPVLLTMAGSFRLLIGELVLVEWLFGWPGLGRLLALTLIAPRVAGPGGHEASAYFLHPPLVAALLMIFTLVFLLADTAATVAVRSVDPRLRAAERGQDG